jgi:hypothetical protein
MEARLAWPRELDSTASRPLWPPPKNPAEGAL